MRAFIRFAAAAAVLSATSALADSRIFIIANESDGYGIDQCLAKGERCGAPMANSYCFLLSAARFLDSGGVPPG